MSIRVNFTSEEIIFEVPTEVSLYLFTIFINLVKYIEFWKKEFVLENSIWALIIDFCLIVWAWLFYETLIFEFFHVMYIFGNKNINFLKPSFSLTSVGWLYELPFVLIRSIIIDEYGPL